MSDEEKKAIDYYTINEYSFGFEIDCDIESFKKAIGIEETDEDTFEKHQIRFKTLLNLIEKQQKEIETYKLLNANIEKDNKRQSIAIIEYQDLLENSISKDKIREKIKDLENEREQLRIDKKVTWDSQIYKIDLKISAYRELLEEE